MQLIQEWIKNKKGTGMEMITSGNYRGSMWNMLEAAVTHLLISRKKVSILTLSSKVASWTWRVKT